MKKYVTPVAVAIVITLFSNCHSTKKSTTENSTGTTKVSYALNVKAIVATNCSPCHIPDRGGNKKPMDTYDALKANIDDAIRRIGLNPTDKGFMPFKKAKLSDSTIAVFKQWRDAGMPE